MEKGGQDGTYSQVTIMVIYKYLIFLSLILVSNTVAAEEFPGQLCHRFSGVTPLTQEDVASTKAFFGGEIEVGGCRVENNRYARIFMYERMHGESSPSGDDYLCVRIRRMVNAGLRRQEGGQGEKIEFPPYSNEIPLNPAYLIWILPRDAGIERDNPDCSLVKNADAILVHHIIEKNTLVRLYKNWKSLLESADSYRELGIHNHVDQLRIQSIELLPFSLDGLYVLNLRRRTARECTGYILSLSTTGSGAFDPVAIQTFDCG